MSVRFQIAAICIAALTMASPTSAQETRLTLSDVLARAREQAPQVIAARLRVEEARGRLQGASLRFASNPEVDAAAGPRRGAGADSTDFEIGVSQMFEPPGRRAARIAGATAALTRETVAVDRALLEVVLVAARAFFQALHASERVRLLDSAERLAANVLEVTDRRYQAGDIAILDVNVARAALARLRAERAGAAAAGAAAIGDLKRVIGLPPSEPVVVSGDFTEARGSDLQSLLARAIERPEVRTFNAEIEEAEAEARLGRSFQRPDLGAGIRYEGEEGDRTILGGVIVTLPVFSRGQELQAVGLARAQRLRAELEALRRAIETEVRAATEVYERYVEAVSVLEREALPRLDENEQLSGRSYEAGQIGLPELLLIRREILETRLLYLDARLAAAVARVERDASAGVLR